MKKLAIFVEGQTEAVFVEELIRQMVDQKSIRVAVFRMTGGNKSIRRMGMIRESVPHDPARPTTCRSSRV